MEAENKGGGHQAVGRVSQTRFMKICTLHESRSNTDASSSLADKDSNRSSSGVTLASVNFKHARQEVHLRSVW